MSCRVKGDSSDSVKVSTYVGVYPAIVLVAITTQDDEVSHLLVAESFVGEVVDLEALAGAASLTLPAGESDFESLPTTPCFRAEVLFVVHGSRFIDERAAAAGELGQKTRLALGRRHRKVTSVERRVVSPIVFRVYTCNTPLIVEAAATQATFQHFSRRPVD